MNPSRIEQLLAIEQLDRDIFRGPVVPSKFERTFGGQVAAQTLVAAAQTIPPEQQLHSLHGYFVAPGKADRPTIFVVDRIRDGRSFSSRSVKAIQDGKTIFLMQSSYHRRGDEGPVHEDKLGQVAKPDDFTMEWDKLRQETRALLDEWSEWDIRVVPNHAFERNPQLASQQLVWFKSKTKLPDDETFHQCSLAYASDMTLLQCAWVPHPGVQVQMASLDHAMWFLRPFRADEWLLYDQTSPSACNGRALTQGRIFDLDGNLVAMVTQEGLGRFLPAGMQAFPMAGIQPK